jgi:hypothetical protein
MISSLIECKEESEKILSVVNLSNIDISNSKPIIIFAIYLLYFSFFFISLPLLKFRSKFQDQVINSLRKLFSECIGTVL